MGGGERFIDPYEAPDPDRDGVLPSSSGMGAETTLDSVRERISAVDRDILGLLAQRGRLARRTRSFKGTGANELYDPVRESAVVREAAERGATLGLDPEEVRHLYWHIVAMCRRAQIDGG